MFDCKFDGDVKICCYAQTQAMVHAHQKKTTQLAPETIAAARGSFDDQTLGRHQTQFFSSCSRFAACWKSQEPLSELHWLLV